MRRILASRPACTVYVDLLLPSRCHCLENKQWNISERLCPFPVSLELESLTVGYCAVCLLCPASSGCPFVSLGVGIHCDLILSHWWWEFLSTGRFVLQSHRILHVDVPCLSLNVPTPCSCGIISKTALLVLFVCTAFVFG